MVVLRNMWATACFAICMMNGAALAASPVTALHGWEIKGDQIDKYSIGIDEKTVRSGKPTAYVKSTAPKIEGFTTIMQMISAGKYGGERVEFSGWLKTSEVKELAGLWMRVDGENGRVLNFDNMGRRPVVGTTDWKKYNVVLDVPNGARDVCFGILLNGTGEVRASDLSFKRVTKDVPVTNQVVDEKLKPEPENLDFTAK